jgi:hypothetical protein
MYELILSVYRSDSKLQIAIVFLPDPGIDDHFNLKNFFVFRNDILVAEYKLLKGCTIVFSDNFRLREVRPLGFKSRRVGWAFLSLSLECSDMVHQLIILLSMLRNQCVLLIH